MFRIKICGVRRPEDIAAVADAGGDAIGLNFFPPSVRYVSPEEDSTAALARLAAERGLMRVGVFVNETIATIRQSTQRVGLDAIQLHGDETLEDGKRLQFEMDRPVIRAIKLPRTPLTTDAIEQAAGPWIDAGCHVLLDADAGRQHGGSGKTLDWASVKSWASTQTTTSWTLAGGLKPENLAEAIEASGATSVDTASGVECPKGVKSAERIREFVRQTFWET